MFSCSLTPGIDLPWENSHILQKQGLKCVWGECQCHSGEHSSFLQSSRTRAPWFLLSWAASCCHREPSALAAFAVTGTDSAGRKRQEIAHQWNGGRLCWERGPCLDYRTLTAGSRKEGNHWVMASKCTKRVGAALTCYTVNWLKEKSGNQQIS